MTLNGWINLLVLVAVLAAICAAFFFLARKNGDEGPTNTAKKARADVGVEGVRRALSRYASLHGFTLLLDLPLQVNGETTRLDAVLVTYAGVVGVRCLGYNGEVFANSDEKEWLWVTQASRQRIPDPVAQCAADARAIRDLLMAEPRLRSLPVECLPVFTDKNLQLAVPKSVRVLRAKELIPTLDKEKYLQDTGCDKEAVAALLAAARQAAGQKA